MWLANTEHVCPPMFNTLFIVWSLGEKTIFIDMAHLNMLIWHGKTNSAMASSIKFAVTVVWWYVCLMSVIVCSLVVEHPWIVSTFIILTLTMLCGSVGFHLFKFLFLACSIPLPFFNLYF